MLDGGNVVPVAEDAIAGGDVHGDSGAFGGLGPVKRSTVPLLVGAVDAQVGDVLGHGLRDVDRASDGDAIEDRRALGIGCRLADVAFRPQRRQVDTLEPVLVTILVEAAALVAGGTSQLVDGDDALTGVAVRRVACLTNVVPVADDLGIGGDLDPDTIGQVGEVHGLIGAAQRAEDAELAEAAGDAFADGIVAGLKLGEERVAIRAGRRGETPGKGEGDAW